MPKLSKRVVDAIRPNSDGKDVFLWDSGDGALKGFGVRMKPSGAGAYIVQYRTAEGRTRRLALGKVGTLTPDEARILARELVAATKGADPSAERHAARASMTVAELCDLYLAEAASRIKASTLAMDRSRIDRHVRPLLGRRTVRSLAPEDIEKMQLDIAGGKTARKRNGRGGVTAGGKGVAARTVGMLGTILELARRRRLISANPARGVDKLPEGKQRRFLSLDEIGLLGAVMRDAGEEGIETRVGLDTIRFLLLTGLRRMEALALPWEWVDTRSRCIRFEDTKDRRATTADRLGRDPAARCASAERGVAFRLSGCSRGRPFRRPAPRAGANMPAREPVGRDGPRAAAQLCRGGGRDGAFPS